MFISLYRSEYYHLFIELFIALFKTDPSEFQNALLIQLIGLSICLHPLGMPSEKVKSGSNLSSTLEIELKLEFVF